MKQFDFAMIGLGVMGRNLLLNMADNGFAVVGFDKDLEKTIALETAATDGTHVKGVNELSEMVALLSIPRKIIMLVPAGKPVDDVLASLQPLLHDGDIVIDGGNSHYTDTIRRIELAKTYGFHFMGMGISGGEQGARFGPSIMPGGDVVAYKNVQPVLEAIAAKATSGEPCVAYMGNGAAGHYVKMVHNGIEYAIMQILAEVYAILKKGKGLSNEQLHELFLEWNEGELQSYLIEITAAIFKQKDTETNADLVDLILDVAGSKGTGKWTSQSAMDLGTAIPVIDAAVTMRSISTLKEERVQAALLYKNNVTEKTVDTDIAIFKEQMFGALYSAIIVCYAQGLAMLQKASTELAMQIPLQDAVKVWREGCIIRSAMLELFYTVCNDKPSITNILLDERIAAIVNKQVVGLRQVVVSATQSGIPAMALSNALNYFDAFVSAQLPLNLTQAQRDFFGAHTYKRIDKEGIFHSIWNG